MTKAQTLRKQLKCYKKSAKHFTVKVALSLVHEYASIGKVWV